MLEKLRFCNDKGESFELLLNDSSKIFDCLSNDLLIAKIHSNGFDRISVKLICLKERKQWIVHTKRNGGQNDPKSMHHKF